MTLSNREWEVLQGIESVVQSMNTRLVLVEAQVSRWEKREKWLFRFSVATIVGFCAWFAKTHLIH